MAYFYNNIKGIPAVNDVSSNEIKYVEIIWNQATPPSLQIFNSEKIDNYGFLVASDYSNTFKKQQILEAGCIIGKSGSGIKLVTTDDEPKIGS